MIFILYSAPKIVNYDTKIIEDIENKIKNNEAISEDETGVILDYICYKTRTILSDDIEHDSFNHKDLYASSIINNYFKELNVITHPCNTKLNIDKKVTENNFLIVELKNTIYGQNIIMPYLIDPTFKQFFTKEKCNVNQEIIKNGTFIKKADPGYYIKKYDIEMISLLLSDGYFLFDSDLAEVYSEAFIKTMVGVKVNEGYNKQPFQYFSVFLNSSKIKLLSKDKLKEKNLLIEPINSKTKKM